MTRDELFQAIKGRKIFVYFGAGYIRVTPSALTIAIQTYKPKTISAEIATESKIIFITLNGYS